MYKVKGGNEMNNSSVRPADDIERIIETYGNMLYRTCFVLLKNESDAEDAVQETIIKYMQKASGFKDCEHEKAWLLTVASNFCKDMLRYRARHPHSDIDSINETPGQAQDSSIVEALMSLPAKFKTVLILYYVEQYRIDEIARIISKTPSAVKMRLQKGRRLLEEKYREEYM